MKTILPQWSWHRDNDKGEGELVAEASELGLEPGSLPNAVEVYSPTTGATRTFKLAGREVGPLNEVIGWSYWDDEVPVVQLRILND
jgi:hypothetical protein